MPTSLADAAAAVLARVDEADSTRVDEFDPVLDVPPAGQGLRPGKRYTTTKATHGGRGSSKRLTTREIVALLAGVEAGDSYAEVARRLGCNEHTVAKIWGQYGQDSRGLARKRLESGAHRLAGTILRSKDAKIALATLAKLDVVREDKHQGGGVQIYFGGSPESDLPAIDVLPLSPALPAPVGETPSDS